VGTGIGLATATLAGTGYAVANRLLDASSASGQLVEPQILRSKAGLLDMTLTASIISATVGGKQVKLLAYNGSVPGPTLWLRPGDKLRVKFVNNLGYTTNLHTHGLHVTPEGSGDNPMVMIADGESHQYEYELPKNHPAGTFWYHPHHHGQAANQTFGGLYGAIVVDEGVNMGPVTERVLVISDVSITTDGRVAGANMMSKMMGREGDYLMVNGAVQPTAPIGRSQERWRIVNACVSRNLNLTVAGGSAKVISRDGHTLETSIAAESIFLSPGNRIDLAVDASGGDIALNYTTVPHPDSMGMLGSAKTYKDYPLVTFEDTGKPGAAGMLMWNPANFEDLRGTRVATTRTFELNMPSMGSMGDMGGMMGSMNHSMSGMGSMAGQFTINGKSFDSARVDTPVKFGDVEEWTIVNKSTMAHPFHLHVWPMQLLHDGSESLAETQYRDVVNVPAKGQVKVRVRFADFKGTAVYHCHILDHEDLGMMGIIQAS